MFKNQEDSYIASTLIDLNLFFLSGFLGNSNEKYGQNVENENVSKAPFHSPSQTPWMSEVLAFSPDSHHPHFSLDFQN